MSLQHNQRGQGVVGLLLALLAVGFVAWFMLRPAHNGVGGTDAGNAISCEQRVSKLVSDTGGIGPQAKAAYDALPRECKRFIPDPSAIAPSVQKVPEQE